MRTVFIHAAMLSTLTASAAYAATSSGNPIPPAQPLVSDGEGASGGRGVRLAAAGTGTLLFVPEAKQSLLVTVGEGGEGRRGRHFRKFRYYYNYSPYYGRRHLYAPGYYRRDYELRCHYRLYRSPPC
jgi:hypothetical protein